MKAYMALFRVRARTLFQYRAAAFAGLMTQWAFGFVMVSVLMAFYQYSDTVQPISLSQAITYTWLGQAMLGMLPWNIDRDVGESIRTGAVAYDLTRPLDLFGYWFARACALRLIPTLMKAIPMFLIATFLMPAPFAMRWPPLAGFLAWLLSIGGALCLSCSITLLMQVTLFWTISGDGITRILPHFVTLLSGMVIPLPLMPSWLQPFLKVQPFSALVNTPNLLFTGALPPSAVWETLLLQGIWSLMFVGLGRLVLHRGEKKLTIAGG